VTLEPPISTASDERAIKVVSLPQGHILFRQGDKGDVAYVVNDGAVGIYRETNGRKVLLATVRKGELFGEMAVLDGSARMATAYALSHCTLTTISAENISSKLKRADPFMRTLIQMLLNNLRSVHDTYAPKSRSLLDVVTLLGREADALNGFLEGNRSSELRALLTPKAKSLEILVQELRRIVTTHRQEDSRSDALPVMADAQTN
jgi:CRP/FNR family cyclic AMP-dependent transcriptional regulator